ncbi:MULTISPECIES: 2,3-dihydro-2,3-dihydroxybenzoate dehydrogenase [unclassified Vibrio]|uniref:2,3-dihydro-2,3-dihydroxybenzoate dehydrogenase n=1 Tax=Vibrio sp. HB236076 TaxID=3232307 RepID=A0AB39HBW6_9VIBR|nr:2,3-dihydro-2,3-dihydroxybenzoate dehydrogenase [Vibrio sp. HB161653]MDP5253796.1 2,3-dihydro-2,3-dihydroxybenzoate dehydrogenase [Vibrio sp. HB161653]
MSERVVLVTGCAQGIGFAVMEALLQQGKRVIATDKNIELLKENSAHLSEQYPHHLRCDALDLSQMEQIEAQIEQWQQDGGQITELVSCAGILHLGPLHQMTLSEVKHTFEVNTFGTLALMQAIAYQMPHDQKPAMVIIGSNAANTPRPNMGAYGASKAALHMMVKCFAIELAEQGIRCNIVSPGSTLTKMQKQLWNDQYGEQQVIEGDSRTYRLGIPLQKLATPEEIAQSVLFLLSPAASHITMHDLRVDGGATLDN